MYLNGNGYIGIVGGYIYKIIKLSKYNNYGICETHWTLVAKGIGCMQCIGHLLAWILVMSIY